MDSLVFSWPKLCNSALNFQQSSLSSSSSSCLSTPLRRHNVSHCISRTRSPLFQLRVTGMDSSHQPSNLHETAGEGHGGEFLAENENVVVTEEDGNVEFMEEDENVELIDEDENGDFVVENRGLMDKEISDILGIKETRPQTGEGCEVSFGNTTWGSKALDIAQEIIPSFNGDLEIFSFKASTDWNIQISLDKLSNREIRLSNDISETCSCNLPVYGSPTVEEIETFTTKYSARLEEAAKDGSVPENLAVVVSSPGAERVIRIPKDLDRFRHLPMYVIYKETADAESEGNTVDGIFNLDSLDLEGQHCTWKLANVRLNRQSLGKGKTFNKKQREWRLDTPFDSLILVRLHLDI